MGLDLAAVLAVYGAVIDGDLTSWSIGKGTIIMQLTKANTFFRRTYTSSRSRNTPRHIGIS
jgi:hypothetical protein